MEIITQNSAQTAHFAALLGQTLPPDTLLILSGPLGVGKTTFAQGLARGLGIKDAVTSPTFMLAQEYYGGRLSFAHLDAYRLENCDVFELGLEEYWQWGGICLIEWGELLYNILPAEYTQITLSYLDEHSRRINITGKDELLIKEIVDENFSY